MKNRYRVTMAAVAVALLCGPLDVQSARAASPGEQGFMKNCAVCHPNGGNIIKPEDTLDRKALEREGIRTPADVVRTM